MSTKIGTMQAPAAGYPFWLPALLTLLAVVTFAFVAVSIENDQAREDAGVGTAQNTVVANTPTELRGGLPATSVGGTLANTPIELRGGFVEAVATDEVRPSTTGRRGVTPRVGTDEPAVDEPNFHSGQLR